MCAQVLAGSTRGMFPASRRPGDVRHWALTAPVFPDQLQQRFHVRYAWGAIQQGRSGVGRPSSVVLDIPPRETSMILRTQRVGRWVRAGKRQGW